ncbi:retinol dehydrogenase 12-like [Pomacea canaliculata]|uniref:retinol dehydrogenase 12-like n=1 Tax=Pomacea canaliculata TaxID=400727 RepID=UPI000D73EE0D|nr:retinol dehydrogenase 12-like [Pomacea canaliculata]
MARDMKDFIENMPNPDAIFRSWWPILIAVGTGVIYALRTWLRGPKCVGGRKLNGKTAVVTGANSGIGKAIAMEFARRGARVILACRNETEGHAVASEIQKETGNINVVFMQLDLSSFKSIHAFVEKFKEKEQHLHLLVNNAGVNMCPEAKTSDNFELQLGVNYLGTFLLTELLLDKLRASAPSRIINTSAAAANLGEINFDNISLTGQYSPGTAFAQSKYAVLLYTLHLSERLKETQVTVNAVNPGVVNSKAHRHMPFKNNSFIRISFGPFVWFLMKTCEDGAQVTIFCATAEELEGVSGKYFKDCQEVKLDEQKTSKELQEKLYKATLQWTKMEKGD